MTLTHVFKSFCEWASGRRLRLSAAIATVCIGGAVVLTLAQTSRRFAVMYDRMNAVAPSLAQRLERDRERRKAQELLRAELLERLDRILARLAEPR